MKLISWQPTVNSNVSRARVDNPTDKNAFGNSGGEEQIAAAIGEGMQTYQKFWLKDQNDKVVDALNEYRQNVNSMLNDENDGLFVTMQGKNAEGIQNAYTAGEKQIRDNIIGKYGLNSQYANAAFMQQIMPDVTSQLATLDKYQRSELDKYAGNQLTTAQDNLINSLVQDPNSFVDKWTAHVTEAKAIMAGRGLDDATQEVKLHDELNAVSKRVLDSMQSTGDYARGLQFAATARAYGADEDMVKNAEKNFVDMKTVESAEDTVDQYLKDHPDIDLSTVDAKQLATDIAATIPIASGTNAQNASIDQVLTAIFGQESAGNYYAYNKDSGAFGKYQFMPKTYRALRKQMGKNPNDRSPKAQDETARYYAEMLYKIGGADGIIIGWYGGSGTARRWKNDADQTHSSSFWTAPVYNNGKKYPSRKAYHDQVVARLGGVGLSPEEVQAQRARQAEAFVGAIKTRQAQIRQNTGTYIDDTQVQLDKMAMNGSTPYQQYSYLQGRYNSADKYTKKSVEFNNMMVRYKNANDSWQNDLQKQANISRGLNANGTLTNDGVKSIQAKIGVSILSNTDLNNAIQAVLNHGGAFTGEQINTLHNSMNNYFNGTGPYAFKNVTKSYIASVTGINSKNITAQDVQVARALLAQKQAEAGEKLTEVTQRRIIQTQYAHYIPLDNKDLADNQKGYISMGRARALGIENIARARDGNYYVNFSNGRRGVYVTQDQLAKAKAGDISL